MLYSTYFGGTNGAKITGLAVDPAGFVVLTGWTGSADFPVVNSPDSVLAATPYHSQVFAARLAPSGNVLVYSKLFPYGPLPPPSIGVPWAGAIAADAFGNAYVAQSLSLIHISEPTRPY